MIELPKGFIPWKPRKSKRYKNGWPEELNGTDKVEVVMGKKTHTVLYDAVQFIDWGTSLSKPYRIYGYRKCDDD